MDYELLSNKPFGVMDLIPKYPYGMKWLMVPKSSKFRRAYQPHEIGDSLILETLQETQVRDLLEDILHPKKERDLSVT